MPKSTERAVLLLTTAAHPRTTAAKKRKHDPGIYRKWTEEEEAAAAAAAAGVSEVGEESPEKVGGSEVCVLREHNTLLVGVCSFQQCVSAVNSGGCTVSSPPKLNQHNTLLTSRLEDITTLFIGLFPPSLR